MARKAVRSKRPSRHRRRARNKRRNALIYRFICFFVIVIAGLLAVTVFFKIENITLSGETRYSKTEILETLDIKEGDNLFFINKITAINKLFDNYVYLDEIKILRKLPDTLSIQVKDCQPVAAAKTSEQYYILDNKGKILESCDINTAKKYIMLIGLNIDGFKEGNNVIEKTDEKTKKLFNLLSVLEKEDMASKVSYISVEKISEITIGYDKRFNVIFGTLDDIDRKIRFLNNIIGEKLSPSDTGIIDLTDKTTARFRPMSTLPKEEIDTMLNFDGTPRDGVDMNTVQPADKDNVEKTNDTKPTDKEA